MFKSTDKMYIRMYVCFYSIAVPNPLHPNQYSHTENHYDQFHAVLVNKPKSLEIALCYELSTACVGVKRSSIQVTETAW